MGKAEDVRTAGAEQGDPRVDKILDAARALIMCLLRFNERDQTLSCRLCHTPGYWDRLHDPQCVVYQLHAAIDEFEASKQPPTADAVREDAQ